MIRTTCTALSGLLALLAPATLAAANAEPTLYVGLLEFLELPDRRCGEAQEVAPLHAHVRVAFRKDADEWHSISEGVTDRRPHLPRELTWNLWSQRGNSRGSVTTADGPCQNHMSGRQIYAQDVTTSKDKLPAPDPVTGKSFFEFASPHPLMPLAASTRPIAQGSPRWWQSTGPGDLTPEQSRIAIREFRKQLPTRPQCEAPETAPIGRVEYPDDQILVRETIDSGSTGILLVRQQLTATRLDCGGFDADEDRDYWMVLYPDGSSRQLGTRMTFLTAADFDGDGKSELLFHWRPVPFPSDGYALFFDNVTKDVRTGWSYN